MMKTKPLSRAQVKAVMAAIADAIYRGSQPFTEAEFRSLEKASSRAKQQGQGRGDVEARPNQKPPVGSLTKREAEVLALLGSGRIEKEIASELCISDRTVRMHLRNATQRLKAGTKIGACVAFALAKKPAGFDR